ncbi:histidine utilization repressor [Alsobacter sp. SYSU M60028]|uniref:Histidine utilization repressor n=1 Tax=Alsobacter ponti TaxID=2962936 RepID=A0ABT1L6R5_9HYPH|nr:histidine utilization repressor [Alsobacter ponti]MCP8937099.1 histidine utilization repressor [Alsobacter ponti]
MTRPQSLHQSILGEIEDKILSGAWPPGHRIPSEHELTAHYGVSRMTVNKVLTQLAAGGLIERRRRAGSFVSRPLTQSAVLDIRDIRTEVAALGLPYRYEVTVRRRRRAAGADRALIDLQAGAPVLELGCVHFAGARPFCREERLISLDAVPEAAEERFDEVAPGAWLVGRVPWTSAEHRIRAVGADRDAAALFSMAEGAACLAVERRTWSAERPVTFVRLTYPGDAHELVARFAPTQG